MEYEQQETEQSLLAGQHLIGSILKNPAIITECDISSDMFFSRPDQIIYETLLEMTADKTAIDPITVTERLLEKTGQEYLERIMLYATQAGGSQNNYKAYAQIVVEAHRKAQAREIARTLTNTLNEPNAVENAIQALMKLTSESKKYEYSFAEAMQVAITDIKERTENKDKLPGVSTGINALNDSTGGFHDSDLIVIAARPAMGKTALVLNMLLRAGEKIGFISGEQGVSQIFQRCLCIEGGVNSSNLRTGNLTESDWDFLLTGASKIKMKKGGQVYDKSSPTIDEVESLARRWVHDYDIKALYIDYLQRLKKPDGKTKTESVSENVQRLKDLARELKIPVIVLAQVKRDVESRNDKRPNMSDISDSSEVEKEADLVITMYRDEYYNENTDQRAVIELNIEKNRHGPTGCVPTKWSSNIMRISDITEVTAGYN